MIKVRQSPIYGQLARLLSRSVWSLGDQALVSLTSFMMMVLLARVLSPDDFGAFVLIYGALLLFNALQSGLFTQPHNVLGSVLVGAEYARYTSTTLLTQLAFSLLLALLAVAGFVVSTVFGWSPSLLLLTMAPAIVAWQIQEYLRRVYYTEDRVRDAFLNDLISYGGQIIGIGLIWKAGELTGPIAIYILAVTSAAAAWVALWQLRDRLIPAFDRDVVRDNWRFGKWLFGASLVQSGRIQLHLVLIGAIINVTAAGLYRAVQNLVAPTHIMMNAIRSIAMPRAAAIYARDGMPAMRHYLVRMSLLGLAPIVMYLIAVSLAAEPLIHRLYAGQYDGYAWLVWLFCLVYFFAYGGQVLTIFLSAMRVTKAVLFAEIITLVTGVGIGLPVIWLFGIGGALMTDIVVGATLLGVLLHRLTIRDQRPLPIAAPMFEFMPMEVQARGN
jgi:O-antigen/teichoic acid export membrane protein